jgi:excisionase family DNA binding protein
MHVAQATQPQQASAPDWRTRATITVEEAADVLGIGRASAYLAANTGDLPVIRIGRRLLVPVAALRRMLGEMDPSNELDPAGNRAEQKASEDGARNTV